MKALSRGLLLYGLLSGCFDAHLAASATDRGQGGTASSGGAPDAGRRTSGPAVDAGDSASGPRHAACVEPLLAFDGEPIDRSNWMLAADGQNAWRSLDCSTAPPLPRCDLTLACPGWDDCIFAVPDEPGYCVPGDAWLEDGLLDPMSYRGGLCHKPVTASVRAALCCAQVAGVDCEPWPRTRPAAPGELCLDNGECEVGLVCARYYDLYGRCACPEAAGNVISDPPFCERPSEVPRWGTPSATLAAGGCVQSAVPGFVTDALLDVSEGYYGMSSLRVKHDAEGYSYVAFADHKHDLHVLSDRKITWPGAEQLETLADLEHYRLPAFVDESVADGRGVHFDFAFTADGQPHIAYSTGTGITIATPAGAGWEREEVPEAAAKELAIAVRSTGERLLAYSTEAGYAAFYVAESATGWDAVPLPPDTQVQDIVLLADGAPRVLLAKGLFDPVAYSARELDGPIAALATGSVAEPSLRVVSAQAAPVAVLLYELTANALVDATLPIQSETVWQLSGSNVREELLEPSLAARADGSPVVVHRTPAGVALSDRTREGLWQTREISPERGRPFAIVDRNDILRVFLTADTDWDGYEDQIRQIREGSCTP